MAKQHQQQQGGGTAVLEPPPAKAAPTSPPAKRPAPAEPAGACVGLPVQFYGEDGPLPGILQRRSITAQGLWDVRVFLSGAATSVTRAAVAYHPTPKPGCWSLLPGWRFTEGE